MAKKKRTRDTAADFARRSNATSRMRSPERMFAAESREPMFDVPAVRAAVSGRDTSPRPTPRPARGSALAPTSTRNKPVPRPSTMEERAAAERADRAARREAGMKAGGKVKKMAYGGKVTKKAKGGFPDLNKDGKVTKADILQGRGVKKMAMGGKCRGMGAATKGGNYSRG